MSVRKLMVPVSLEFTSVIAKASSFAANSPENFILIWSVLSICLDLNSSTKEFVIEGAPGRIRF
jgi:hypothetical protein